MLTGKLERILCQAYLQETVCIIPLIKVVPVFVSKISLSLHLIILATIQFEKVYDG